MKNKLYLLAITFFLTRITFAQSWQAYSPTAGFDINVVKIVGPGHIVIGGGREAHDSLQVMFNSTDYGVTWIENPYDGLESWNKSIAFGTALKGFGVGYQGRIVKTTDGGQNWASPVFPTGNNLNGIVSVNPSVYFAVGGLQTPVARQTILKSGNADSIWNVVYDTAGPCLQSVFFTDTLHGIAVGDSGIILTTINGGTSWINTQGPLQRGLNSVTFIDANKGFIAGGDVNHRTILGTTNGGVNWNVIVDSAGAALNSISFADSLVGYAVGDSASIFKTSDGGLTWTQLIIDSTIAADAQLRSVDFYNESFGVIGGKAGVLYVYAKLLSYSRFQTQPVASLTPVSATLTGQVDSLTAPMDLFFEYDSTTSFTNTVQASPAHVNDTMLHAVTADIYSLKPFTTYYYRLKGISNGSTYYGNILTFYTGYPTVDTTFITLTATQVTSTGAVLNGSINKAYFSSSASVSFQYGATTHLGNEVQGGTLNVNADSSYYVSAPVTGLPTDTTFYYYRLKIVADGNVYLGNIRQLHTGTPDIPNWDFKNWHTITATLPSHWFISTDSFARVPGHSGNYALQITGPTVAAQGVPLDHPVGGSPFAGRPDSFSVYLKYNIQPHDTGFIGLYLSKNRQAVAPFNSYPITGSSGGNFRRMSYPITYSSADMPDSIIMLFISGNAFKQVTDTIYMKNSLTIDDISFNGTAANVYNNDFESWFDYTVERPEGWKGLSYFVDSAHIPLVPMISKVVLTDPTDYAIQLKTVDIDGSVVLGELSTYEPFFKNTPDFPVSHKYQTLTGYYEYFPENGDSIQMSVSLKKGGKFGTSIGNARRAFKQTQATFVPFEIHINYYSFSGEDSSLPDWGTIDFGDGEYPVTGKHTKLIIDKLRFDGFAGMDTSTSVISGIVSPSSVAFDENGVKVYPNPSNSLMILEISETVSDESVIQLYNVDGQKQKEIRMAGNENKTSFTVSDIAPGIYLLKWISGNTAVNKKIVVIK